MNTYELSQDNGKFIQTIFFTLGTGKKYYVLKNSVPYLTVEVNSTDNPFDKPFIFNKYLCIGIYEKIAFIDLEKLNVRFDNVEMYFGYFDVYNDTLFVSSGVGITAYDKNLNIIWENSHLAFDGVVINNISDDGKYLNIMCELDPPNGWVSKKVDIISGTEC